MFFLVSFIRKLHVCGMVFKNFRRVYHEGCLTVFIDGIYSRMYVCYLKSKLCIIIKVKNNLQCGTHTYCLWNHYVSTSRNQEHVLMAFPSILIISKMLWNHLAITLIFVRFVVVIIIIIKVPLFYRTHVPFVYILGIPYISHF